MNMNMHMLQGNTNTWPTTAMTTTSQAINGTSVPLQVPNLISTNTGMSRTGSHMNGLGMGMVNSMSSLVNASQLNSMNMNHRIAHDADLSNQMMNMNLGSMGLHNITSPPMTGNVGNNNMYLERNIASIANDSNTSSNVNKKLHHNGSSTTGIDNSSGHSRKSDRIHLVDGTSGFASSNSKLSNNVNNNIGNSNNNNNGNNNNNNNNNNINSGANVPSITHPEFIAHQPPGFGYVPSDTLMATNMSGLSRQMSSGTVSINRTFGYQGPSPNDLSPRIFNTGHNTFGFSSTTNPTVFGGNSMANHLGAPNTGISYFSQGLISPPISPDMSVGTNKQFQFPVQANNVTTTNVSQPILKKQNKKKNNNSFYSLFFPPPPPLSFSNLLFFSLFCDRFLFLCITLNHFGEPQAKIKAV
ncbi:Rab GTPase domain-containing protein [Reticulomyxa filosa]|uniref:Rab GTPase domain-containing protein n=1 Tax=Reticulomyxa filosa TaxID=46433 RepID=X6NYN6_RETFI|nr:Rab GTPase domain-containing protein [Reticulomyxa filosa]|eukprot:ETO31003.1 Rab GTPase domain-containing protein [Reticulomyxa filosa]